MRILFPRTRNLSITVYWFFTCSNLKIWGRIYFSGDYNEIIMRVKIFLIFNLSIGSRFDPDLRGAQLLYYEEALLLVFNQAYSPLIKIIFKMSVLLIYKLSLEVVLHKSRTCKALPCEHCCTSLDILLGLESTLNFWSRLKHRLAKSVKISSSAFFA